MALLPDAGALRIHVYDGVAGTSFERTKVMKTIMSTFGNAVLVAAIIVCSLVALPFVAILYLIPSVRDAFDQLAYEDAMRG